MLDWMFTLPAYTLINEVRNLGWIQWVLNLPILSGWGNTQMSGCAHGTCTCWAARRHIPLGPSDSLSALRILQKKNVNLEIQKFGKTIEIKKRKLPACAPSSALLFSFKVSVLICEKSTSTNMKSKRSPAMLTFPTETTLKSITTLSDSHTEKYSKQLNLCLKSCGATNWFEWKYSLMQNNTGYQVYLPMPWHP